MIFSIATLGCKVNQYESQRIREALTAAGYEEVPFGHAGVDLCVINTCTVTHRSDAEGRRLMRRALRIAARVVVTGCQAVVAPESIQAVSPRLEVATPQAVGALLALELPGYISGFGAHARAFVKVQQGCDQNCAYCIVPRARGGPSSRTEEEIVHEINTLHDNGFQEVVLTGINMGLYRGGLAPLLGRILEATSIPRIRLSSIEPWTVGDELLRLVLEEPRVCQHLHLPLQSGTDAILEAMGRPYDTHYFRDLVGRIRSRSRDVALGSDVMVGFPGEDSETFSRSRQFLHELDLTYLHVFPYSPRPGTRAEKMPAQVDEAQKKARVKELRGLSAAKFAAFAASQTGRAQELLVTHAGDGACAGITSNYLRLRLAGAGRPGQIVPVRITGNQTAVRQGVPHG